MKVSVIVPTYNEEEVVGECLRSLLKQSYKEIELNLDGKGKYVITSETLALIKPTARIFHPLPHVEEINLPLEVEQNDPRIAYFRQAENGLYMRMALLEMLLNKRIKKGKNTVLS